MKTLSIVIPVYNESESLRPLNEAINAALGALDISWKVILVNDGSRDDSWEIINDIAKHDPDHYLGIDFRRNFGQTAAIAAGIDASDGEIIILMDADLQNDPEDIPLLLNKLDEGYDVVSGWRKSRKDTFLTRTLPSRIANWLISVVSGVHLHDYGCTLKAYRREVITGFRLYGEMHRFIPAYAGSVGANIVEIPVTHHPRKFGVSKYGLGRTFKVILDLFTVKFLISYSQKPIYLFGGIGAGLVTLSFGSLGMLIWRRIFLDEHMIRSPLLLLTVMLFILGFQSLLLGLIAELLVRTYHEAQKKTTYHIREKTN